MHKDQTTLQKVVKYAKSTYFPHSAPLHQFYKNWFNLVDLADRYYYKEQQTQWESTLEIQDAVLNYVTTYDQCLYFGHPAKIWKEEGIQNQVSHFSY